MIREDGIVGCILAGGKSSRMGKDKSLLLVDGVSLIERAAIVMREVFESVVVVSDRIDQYRFLGLSVLQDIKKNCGPLGGIHAAFVQTEAESLFVIACDMPFVSPDLIRYIVNARSDTGAAVPTMGGRVHPLCGLYSRTSLPIIEGSLSQGIYRLQTVLKELKPAIIPLTPELPFYKPNLLDNLNETEDVELAFRSMIPAA